MTAFIWQPAPEPIEESALVERVIAMSGSGREPCSAASLAMLGALSRELLSDPQSRAVPQYVALAYWLRPAALQRLTGELTQDERPGRLRVSRGVALHLPPTNVDTIFVYSWAMSVLAGNANIVRLASSLSGDTQWLVALVARVIAAHGEAGRHVFCHYGYGQAIEGSIAGQSDLRMIWGGDAKVDAVSRTPIRPDGLSIGFPDRRSLSIFSAQAYAAAGDDARDALAVQFSNDIFWFDQMGCGSPRLLVWLGEPGDLSADFYRRVQACAAKKQYALETGAVIGKFSLSNDLMAEGTSRHYATFGNALHVNRVLDPAAALSQTVGGGFLCDWCVDSLDEVPAAVSRQTQTITHFGLTPEQLEQLALSIGSRGGYRIVPVGQALQFDNLWDGVDLYEHMTRKILIRY